MKTERTVKLILIDDKNKVLLLQRGESHPTQSLHWDFPGGFLDGDEEPLDSLLREVSEETGLEFSKNRFEIVFATTENIEGQSRVRIVYTGKLQGLTPGIKLSWEHKDYKWLPIGEALKLLIAMRYKYQALKYLSDNDILHGLN